MSEIYQFSNYKGLQFRDLNNVNVAPLANSERATTFEVFKKQETVVEAFKNKPSGTIKEEVRILGREDAGGITIEAIYKYKPNYRDDKVPTEERRSFRIPRPAINFLVWYRTGGEDTGYFCRNLIANGIYAADQKTITYSTILNGNTNSNNPDGFTPDYQAKLYKFPEGLKYSFVLSGESEASVEDIVDSITDAIEGEPATVYPDITYNFKGIEYVTGQEQEVIKWPAYFYSAVTFGGGNDHPIFGTNSCPTPPGVQDVPNETSVVHFGWGPQGYDRLAPPDENGWYGRLPNPVVDLNDLYKGLYLNGRPEHLFYTWSTDAAGNYYVCRCFGHLYHTSGRIIVNIGPWYNVESPGNIGGIGPATYEVFYIYQVYDKFFRLKQTQKVSASVEAAMTNWYTLDSWGNWMGRIYDPRVQLPLMPHGETTRKICYDISAESDPSAGAKAAGYMYPWFQVSKQVTNPQTGSKFMLTNVFVPIYSEGTCLLIPMAENQVKSWYDDYASDELIELLREAYPGGHQIQQYNRYFTDYIPVAFAVFESSLHGLYTNDSYELASYLGSFEFDHAREPKLLYSYFISAKHVYGEATIQAANTKLEELKAQYSEEPAYYFDLKNFIGCMMDPLPYLSRAFPPKYKEVGAFPSKYELKEFYAKYPSYSTYFGVIT